MHKAFKLTVVLIIVLLFLLTLVSCKENKQTGDAVNKSGHPVNVARVTLGTLDGGTVVSGKLEALESADIVPKIPGRVARISVDIGSNVRVGEVLFNLDNAELAAAVSQAEASLASAQASFEVSRVNYERGKKLLADGAISQSDFDSKFELSYKTGMQQVAQARAALDMARANYSNTIITAPFSGVVTNRKANPGEMATQQAPVVSLVNISKVVVRATVSEDQVNFLKEGQKVQVRVTAVSNNVFEGTITNIALAAESSSKAYPIKIQIDNQDKVLKPGMFAEVQLSTAPSGQGMLVPRESVLTSTDGNVVFIAKDGAARKLAVGVGRSDGKFTEITSGLEEGQEVVIEGTDGLEDGTLIYLNP